MRADSVWESPAIASSASGSSMLSAQKLEATATSIIGSGQVPVDSVSKVSHDSQPILGVTPVKQAQGMQERAQQDQSYTMGRLPSAGRAKGKKNGWQKFAACFAE